MCVFENGTVFRSDEATLADQRLVATWLMGYTWFCSIRLWGKTMKKLLALLLVLILLGLGGYAAWRYMLKGEPLPFLSPYPKELAQLRDEVGIEVNDQGFTTLVARQRADLLFLEGFHHGQSQGERLGLLRDLFKGRKVADLPRDLQQLSALFHFLDLELVAGECELLYTGSLQALLQAYADGLNQGSAAAEPWTVRDVLLMQRGYAFLLGRNFIKEWCAQRLAARFGAETFARCTSYPLGDFGALTQGISLDPGLVALQGKPLLETVRLYDDHGNLAVNVRTHPFLAFAFEPTVMELEGAWSARGLALVGQPFLYSAQTGQLAFYRQPVLADDEQFSFSPRITDEEVEGFSRNEQAPGLADHDEAPLAGPQGRRVSRLAFGPKDTDTFYRWDGLRPSADLAALYALLEANTLDEALSAYQYHQVPATELTLITPSRQVVNMLALPSDPRLIEQSSLFTGAFTRIGQRLDSITASGCRSDLRWTTEQLGQPGRSALDQELQAMLRFYLKGPIREEQIDPATQEALLDLLGPEPRPDRDAFLQTLWQRFFTLLEERHLDQASRPLTLGLPLVCQRLVLELYGHAARDQDLPPAAQVERTKTIADQLLAAYLPWGLAKGERSTFLLPSGKGQPSTVRPETLAPSGDAAEAWFFVDRGNFISQVSTYTLRLDRDMDFWRYRYARDRELGEPRLVTTPVAGKLTMIRPKL